MTMMPDYLIRMLTVFGALNLVILTSESASISATNSHSLDSKLPKLKRDSRAKVSTVELDTQETGYLPTAYQTADSGYGYDAGKNSYGKQASDWSLYDQGE